MSDKLYRWIKLILLAIFVAGSLCIGSQIARNGRYIQYDERRDWIPTGPSSSVERRVIDTRTGLVYPTKDAPEEQNNDQQPPR